MQNKPQGEQEIYVLKITTNQQDDWQASIKNIQERTTKLFKTPENFSQHLNQLVKPGKHNKIA